MTTRLDPVTEFREDHRKVRDTVLELASAAENGDLEKARQLLATLDAITGPHFRYEEEHLYPKLREFLGEYVDQLVCEHDGAIETAKTAAALLSRPALTQEEAITAARAARALLIHVSNCDGLNILTERLTKEQLEQLADYFQEARDAGVPLIKWSETIRNK